MNETDCNHEPAVVRQSTCECGAQITFPELTYWDITHDGSGRVNVKIGLGHDIAPLAFSFPHDLGLAIVKTIIDASMEARDHEDLEREELGVTTVVTKSAGSDGAVVVFVDTPLFEPNGSDGGPGLRILLNDEEAYVGVPYAPVQDEEEKGVA